MGSRFPTLVPQHRENPPEHRRWERRRRHAPPPGPDGNRVPCRTAGHAERPGHRPAALGGAHPSRLVRPPRVGVPDQADFTEGGRAERTPRHDERTATAAERPRVGLLPPQRREDRRRDRLRPHRDGTDIRGSSNPAGHPEGDRRPSNRLQRRQPGRGVSRCPGQLDADQERERGRVQEQRDRRTRGHQGLRDGDRQAEHPLHGSLRHAHVSRGPVPGGRARRSRPPARTVDDHLLRVRPGPHRPPPRSRNRHQRNATAPRRGGRRPPDRRRRDTRGLVPPEQLQGHQGGGGRRRLPPRQAQELVGRHPRRDPVQRKRLEEQHREGDLPARQGRHHPRLRGRLRRQEVRRPHRLLRPGRVPDAHSRLHPGHKPRQG